MHAGLVIRKTGLDSAGPMTQLERSMGKNDVGCAWIAAVGIICLTVYTIVGMIIKYLENASLR